MTGPTERVHGDSLSGLFGSLGARVAGGRIGLGAGIGAFAGGMLSDLRNQEKPSTAIQVNMFTGVAAAVIAVKSKPLINKGVDALIEHTLKHDVSGPRKVLEWIGKNKAANPLFNQLVSKTALGSVVLGLSIPMVHRIVQGIYHNSALKRNQTSIKELEAYLPENCDRHQPDYRREPMPPGNLRIHGTYSKCK